ncbi:MAG: nicotinamide-nucleotide amidohydrolase family protein [Dehalococcoidia bacterium]|nr:MAG: nicotinamide-nucleotide amidohydrolase family protein [Dehalococcoidia bacterium]
MLEEEIIGLLVESDKTLAVAESCTGGLIGHRLTQVSGSSAAFLGGVIAYHNSVKEKPLGVPADVLESEGAVSEATAVAMAEGVRRLLGADIALAVTGIAGPTGGTEERPVGLTYIALSAAPAVLTCERHLWQGKREENKDSSATAALSLLYRHLKER